jgi:hypothetical protein
MKSAFTLLLIVTFFWSCSKPDSDVDTNTPPTDPPVVLNNKTYQNNVEVWYNTLTFELESTYTLLDTIPPPNGLFHFLSALCAADDSVRINWTVNGKPVASQQSKVWNETAQKYRITTMAGYDPTKQPSKYPITIAFYFRNANKTVIRESQMTLIPKTYVFDMFRINFGMSKAQIKEPETARIGTNPSPNQGWSEPSPNTALINSSATLGTGSYTYYEFEDGKLKRISEVADSESSEFYLFHRTMSLKIPGFFNSSRTDLRNPFPVTQPIIWNNGKIKFTLSKKDVQLDAVTTKKLYAITYEKL